MIVTALGAAWIAVSILTAPVLGRIPAIADRVGQLATVTPLSPPAATSGEEARRRDLLPARLSPRAGLATSRNWRRFRRELQAHGWLVGLLVAGLVCVAVPLLTRGQYVAWDGLHQIPAGGAR